VNPVPPIYVYGVVAGGARIPAGTGIDGQPLRLVTAEDVGAVVSDLRDSAPRLDREAMTTHARVLEQVLESQTVLPTRFGVVMEDDGAVRERLLDVHRDHLIYQLERLDGRVELSLRATYQEEPLLREILAEEPEIRSIHEAIRGTSEAATYFDRIRLGELIAAAVEARRRRDSEEIMSILAPLAEEFHLSEPRHERTALSAAFLTARNQIGAFDEAVDGVGRSQQNRMRLKYTGPLPPHSFVTLEAGS
jgi:hypothetical protein